MFPLPLVVAIRPWGGGGGRGAGGGAAAAGALALAALPPGWRWAGMASLAVSLVWHWRRQPPVTRLRGHADGRLEIAEATGDWHPARVHGDSLALPWLTRLRLVLPDRRRHARGLILADSLPAGDFRRLRVWLRWRADTGAAGSVAEPGSG